jgi:hypothetical protein
MAKLTYFLVALMVAASQAFAPSSQVRSASPAFVGSSSFQKAGAASNTALFAEDTFWEGEYPPSKVLGPIMSKMPSGVLGVLSLALLALCVVSVEASATLAKGPDAVATGSWVHWDLILSGLAGPLAWGTHVACWIQRKNGM